MRILQKLLDNLGSLWNTLPKEVPLFTITKGSGQHSRITVDKGFLYFHSMPYHEGIPQRQEVALDELTAAEFVGIVQGMGYVIAYTSEALSHGLDVHKPFVMIEATDLPLTATLSAFTSNLWKIMYPVYRVLREAEFDTSEAIKAWYRHMADGEWLDFWADFFNIKREPNEDDNNFSRRFTMWMFNPKTNNVALEELLSYRLQDREIEVRDRGILQFELIVGTKYIADASDLHKILRETKGAGIEYFLNYQAGLMEEQYPTNWADVHGKPFTQMDGGSPSLALVIPSHAEIYPTLPIGYDGFNREDVIGAIGSTETGQAWEAIGDAVFRIVDGTLARYTGVNMCARFNVGVSEYNVTARITYRNGCSLAFRVQDDLNLYYVTMSDTLVQLHALIGGSTMSYGNYAGTFYPDRMYEVRAEVRRRTIKVYLDGALIITRDHGADMLMHDNSYVGIRSPGTAGRMDYIKVEPSGMLLQESGVTLVQKTGTEAFAAPSEDVPNVAISKSYVEAVSSALEAALTTLSTAASESNKIAYDEFTGKPGTGSVEYGVLASGQTIEHFTTNAPAGLPSIDESYGWSGDAGSNEGVRTLQSGRRGSNTGYLAIDVGQVNYAYHTQSIPYRRTSDLADEFSNAPAFRIKDLTNMFRVDMNGTSVSLVKIIDGTKHTLDSATMRNVSGNIYEYFITVNGASIAVTIVAQGVVVKLGATDSDLSAFTKVGSYFITTGISPAYDRGCILMLEVTPVGKVVTSEHGQRVKRLTEDTYTLPPGSNIGTSFETNHSEIRGDSELISPTGTQQDTAFVTLTVGGAVVDSRII